MWQIWTKSTLSVHSCTRNVLLHHGHASCLSLSSSPLVNSLIKNWLFKTTPDIDEPPFQFIHTMDLSVVHTMLHDSADLIVHSTEIRGVWRPQVRRKKVWHFLTQHFNCCTCAARCASALSCMNTIKPLADFLRVAGSSITSLWCREAASKKSVRDITRISCFVTTMKLLHAWQIYSKVFCEEVYVVVFFKVVQQQAIGEVGNSTMCLWADNFCLQQWKNY